MKPIEEQTILTTGATDGLGKFVARDLAARGAKVILHGRNAKKGEAVRDEIETDTGNKNLNYYNADFSSLDEVRQLANRITKDYDQLDVLINNAGIGFGGPGDKRAESRDGYELRFQVNYLAGFLLTMQLLPLLRQSKGARVVNVASAGQHTLDFDDVLLEQHYSGHRAYGQSKLAQIMFTVELAGRLDGNETTVNALHPATYMDTKMVRDSGIDPANSIKKGAEAVEYLAVSPELNNVTGRYFNGKQRGRANAQAYNKQARLQLWKLSEDWTGIRKEKK